MQRLVREDVLAVLARFGVAEASRATTTDATEEVVLLAKADFASVDVRQVTLALMEALPHTKVWVIEDDPKWVTEPI